MKMCWGEEGIWKEDVLELIVGDESRRSTASTSDDTSRWSEGTTLLKQRCPDAASAFVQDRWEGGKAGRFQTGKGGKVGAQVKELG